MFFVVKAGIVVRLGIAIRQEIVDCGEIWSVRYEQREAGMMEEKQLILMDFSGVYEEQEFWKDEALSRVDVRGISGCNCYCDGEAYECLMEHIREFPAEGIHFLDSGNYHYMSLLWLKKVQEPFRLVLFDNHTDMQPPAFGGLLSCGGWAAEALRVAGGVGGTETGVAEAMLREVILIGPDAEAFSQVEPEIRERVRFLSREELCEDSDGLRRFLAEIPGDLPLYLSVDKDVLCPGDACTSWSQGDLRLSELEGAVGFLIEQRRVIGMDVCGERDPGENADGSCNDRANAALLKLWKKKATGK